MTGDLRIEPATRERWSMKVRVFYTCYSTGESVDSSSPYETDFDTMVSMAQQLLRAEGDFFGIVDERGRTLQFMVQGEGEIWMEIPVPAEGGSYGRLLAVPDLEHTLLSVQHPLDPSGIDGLQFEAW